MNRAATGMDVHGSAASRVVFGWDPLRVSGTLFLAACAVMVSEKVDRAIVATSGAGLVISLGISNQETGIRGPAMSRP